MKFENYMFMEFPSRSSNEALLDRQWHASPHNWIQPWRNWEIFAQQFRKRLPTALYMPIRSRLDRLFCDAGF